jgi:integrase
LHLLLVHGKELFDKPILKIKAKTIHDAIRPLWDRTPKQARRALVRIKNVFDYALTNHWYFGDNPARWEGKQEVLFPKLPKTEPNHFPAMPYEDVPEFMPALRQRQNNSVAAVALEFGILTAARPDETRGMRWSEVVDFEKNRLWSIPAERMKEGRAHTVPLPDRPLELLKRRYEQRAIGCDYVFSAHRRPTPLDEKAMRQILRKMGVVGATVKGFRSSFSDWAGDETDFASETIEACLAHAVGNQSARAYRRRTALEKRRELMKKWAEYCEALCKAAMRAPE